MAKRNYVELISGRVVRTANINWHPKCLKCDQCGKWLENDGNANIEHGTEIELDKSARCLTDQFHCQLCYDYKCLICAARRHPIGNERAIFFTKKKEKLN
ncbi:hypothetical protein X798_04859 [Onchocerca flexuosa]|uniref:LIM zinc-binding domain-containing protein n=1 Tax=Onchocerca flexuosa TaxID=387005 RepID=A0A238BTE8_9BILA|nr:hypothetical protein X798_04859 [Onchocerca flexuosa]